MTLSQRQLDDVTGLEPIVRTISGLSSEARAAALSNDREALVSLALALSVQAGTLRDQAVELANDLLNVWEA